MRYVTEVHFESIWIIEDITKFPDNLTAENKITIREIKSKVSSLYIVWVYILLACKFIYLYLIFI